MRTCKQSLQVGDDRPILAPFNDGDPAVDAERYEWVPVADIHMPRGFRLVRRRKIILIRPQE